MLTIGYKLSEMAGDVETATDDLISIQLVCI